MYSDIPPSQETPNYQDIQFSSFGAADVKEAPKNFPLLHLKRTVFPHEKNCSGFALQKNTKGPTLEPEFSLSFLFVPTYPLHDGATGKNLVEDLLPHSKLSSKFLC